MAKELEIGDFKLTDAFAVGIAKQVTERALTPLVGNGTPQSGFVKLLGAYLLDRFVKGRIGNWVATALVVDGVEDLVSAMLPQVMGGMGLAQEQELVI